MTLSSIGQILIAVTMTSLAQVASKYGVGQVDLKPAMGLIHQVFALVFSPFVIIGLALYVGSVGVWLFVLRNTDLSLAYPFVSLSFILVLLLSAFVLGESITATRIAGSFIIILGLIILAR